MRRIIGRSAQKLCCGSGIAAFLSISALAISSAKADSIQDLVTNYAGPTWVSISHSTDVTALDFAATGTPTGGYTPTDIVDPNENDNNGSFTMNIDLTGASIASVADPDTGGTDYTYTLTNTQNDYLTEQVYVANVPQTVFDTSHNVVQAVYFGRMDLGAGFNFYWFAFQEAPNSPYAKTGDLLGGYMLASSSNFGDIKTFDISSVPATNSAQGGIVLMLVMGIGAAWRKIRNRQGAAVDLA